jgi:excisionase family DNA binding protein
MDEGNGHDDLLAPREVATLLGVKPTTVSLWERRGKLSAIRTIGGHRRFYRSEVQRAITAVEIADD